MRFELHDGVPDLIVPEGLGRRIESLVGRRRDLWVVAALVGLVLLAVFVLRMRTPSPQIAPPAAPEVERSRRPSARVFVHVAGEVRAPGLYTLREGARVADALRAAGGPSGRADVDAINLAEVVADGMKIEVPTKGGGAPLAVGTPAPSAGSSTPAPTVIDLNSADATALETIPGIGPVLAGAIVSHRDDNGPFPSVDALLEVSGIGPATLESVRPYVRV